MTVCDFRLKGRKDSGQFGDRAYIKRDFTKFPMNHKDRVTARFESTVDKREVRGAVAAETGGIKA